MRRIFTLSMVALAWLVTGCSDAGKQALPDQNDSADLTDAVPRPDGPGPTDVPTSDCGPMPNAGGCNECECIGGSWSCTLILCDIGPADLPDVFSPPPPDAIPGGDDYQVTGNCCSSNDECTTAMACVGATDEAEGTCWHKPDSSLCYQDADCPAWHTCHEGNACACGELDCVTKAGKCVPAGAGCCDSDADCPEGTRCEMKEGEPTGHCLPLPVKPNQCWNASDCDPGETCVDAWWADCAYFFTDPFRFGYCQDAAFAECVAAHSGCECYEDCADGYTVLVYYPATAGEFPSDINPPQELLDVAVAKYECGVCSCTETWSLHLDGGEWVQLLEGGVDAFCKELLQYNEQCDDCLTVWQGGCC